MSRREKPISTEIIETNGHSYRKHTYASGSTSTEPVETFVDTLRMVGTLGGLLLLIVGLTTVWIFAAHAVLRGRLSYEAIVPTHIVAALGIAWASILFGGFSESKRVAITIPLIAAPLATLFIFGFARAL
jgi:hypothetical protein